MPDSPAPTGAAPTDDLGADLSSAWDSQVSDSTDATGAPDPSASPSAGTDPASSPAGAGGDAGRSRDEQGRFTKAERAAQAAAAAQAPTEFKIPEKWPADVRAQLEAMHKANPAHAEFVLKQYAHFRGEASRYVQSQEKRIEKLATVQSQLDDLLSRGREARALKGIDEPTYIRNLVAAGDFLERHPVEGLKYLAKQYGVDLSNLDALQGGGAPAIPPEVREMQERLARHEAAFRAMTQESEHAQLAQAGDWINRFASQTDAQGQPLYPYFDDVLPEICTIVQHQRDNGKQVDVHAAYKSAIRMNESVWLKEQTRTNEASRRDAESKRAREIEDAKRAGFSVSGSGGASDTPLDDLGAELSRQYDKHFS